MLSEIVREILISDRGIRLTHEYFTFEGLPVELQREPPDVAIAASERADVLSLAQTLHACNPRLRVLTIGGGGRETLLYQELGEISPDTLLAAVRGTRTLT
jgi:hypothetical protein